MTVSARTSKHWAYPGLEIPEAWASLEEFVQWYKAAGFPIMPPSDMQVYVTDISYSAIVFRRDRYQVEMYLLAPDATFNEHSHGFDLQLVFLGGQMHAYKQGSGDRFMPYGCTPSRNQNPDVRHQDSGKLSSYTKAGEAHKFYTLRQGAMIFNIEMWEPEDTMASATLNYDGEPFGPVHQANLNTHKERTK